MYQVSVDFHDNAVQAPKNVESLEQLGAYLESIPNMIGFEIHRTATVRIRNKYKNPNQNALPGLTA